jgi:hypothetical protein
VAITWRRPSWIDIEQNLSIQPKNRGDSVVGADAALIAWNQLFRDPSFGAVILESIPPKETHRVVGFGCAVFVASHFADNAITNPRPDLNSRIIMAVHAGEPILPPRDDVARANASQGLDIVVLYASSLRNDLLTASEKQDALALLASTFVEWYAGFRLRRVICETADEQTRRNIEASVVYQTVAKFPDVGRTLHCMSRESVDLLSSSFGNILFRFSPPQLKLRESDQQLLLAALRGATDTELANELGVSFAAVKARWRSTFSRIAETMPELFGDDYKDDEYRGRQKRHQVLAYVRTHPEELRPYCKSNSLDSRHQDGASAGK